MLTSKREREAPAADPVTTTTRPPVARRMPVGAEVQPDGAVHFRVWAPAPKRVELVVEHDAAAAQAPLAIALEPEGGGYWGTVTRAARAGSRYRFRLDGGSALFPDPASRFQPTGPHGPSEVIDPDSFSWTDEAWAGARLPGQVIYELHVGTFTPQGDWAGARGRLPHLRDLGVTAIELMPVADFAGTFGWGYDGVDLFAPYHRYGRPDDLRRFVDEAHRLGLAVLLDVVYNHLGPDGNYLARFAPGYFSDKATEWGAAINYDGADAAPVREFFAENAAYWIREFHLDGLRIDATQSIFDESDDHIIAALVRRARAAAPGGRPIVIVGENEPQHPHLARPPERGGLGLDGLWNDDLHHAAVVALTGRNEAYYHDYLGAPQEFISAAKYGYLYQGQRYAWQNKRRGRSARGLAPASFVAYLENHDQVANSATGLRLWHTTTPGRGRAMTALLLLGPWTPMLFQGQEWSASSPFLFFADHNAELAPLVRQGRVEFLTQFPRCATAETRERLWDPGARATFEASRLDWSEPAGPRGQQSLALHRDLLALRRTDPVLQAQGTDGVRIDGAVLGAECFLLRYLAPRESDDRLLIVNMGRDLAVDPAPEPLLAPPEGARWITLWSSESVRYGGDGTPPLDSEEHGWRAPGHAAVLLAGAATADDPIENR